MLHSDDGMDAYPVSDVDVGRCGRTEGEAAAEAFAPTICLGGRLSLRWQEWRS